MRWERTEECNNTSNFNSRDCHIQCAFLKRPWKFNWSKKCISFFSAVIIICTKGMGNSSDAKVDIAVIQISPHYKKRLLVNHCPLIFARLFSQVEAVNSYRGKQDLFSWKGQLTNNHNPPFRCTVQKSVKICFEKHWSTHI